ncbi:CAP domain-containing protein, partial [Escherichia coli]|nr:CAP domain-containing protein [Escherichia coli]
EAVRPPRGNDIELRAFEMMNARRLLAGLRPLVWSDDLAELARLHSRNMASGKFFSHKDLDGGYVDDRAARLGIFNWIAIGENIAYL